jgi:ribonuclease R
MDKQTEKLIDRWLFHAAKSGDLKLPLGRAAEKPEIKEVKDEKGAKGKKSSRRPDKKVMPAAAPQVAFDRFTTEALQFLTAAGVVTQKHNQYYVQNQFTGAFSAAKSGVGFVPAASRVEAVVPFADRGGALHRDKVRIRVTGFGRGRMTARVEAIVEPFSGEYLARLAGPARGADDLQLAELVDLPDRPYVLVSLPAAAKKKKRKGDADESLIYLTRTTQQKQYMREHQSGGYSRAQAFVFEPSGRAVREDRKGDLERLRLRFMLPEDFEKSLIPSKSDLTRKVKAEMKNKARQRVEGRYIFTIDGEDAKDFDDAISVTRRPNGYELDVHIADVSFFVKPGTPLFDEALKRGNSYYLAGGVIPMLPEILSNEFCSLKPKTERLAFTARMFFDATGRMTGHEIFRSVIYIDKRYTYKEAHLDLKKKSSLLAPALELADILIARRDREGRIDLNIAEQKAVYDKQGRFRGIDVQQRLNSHRLVEECMLSANQAVANQANRHGIPVLHRNHESMPPEKLEKLNRYLEKYASRLKIRGVDQKEIGRVLAHEGLDPVREVFQFLLLRSFMQANYMPESKGHWGLAFEEYAHFTSPIRRFADLVTHLQLASHLDKEKRVFNMGELEYFGREASRLERIAFEAERADKKLLAVRAMGNRIGESFNCWLSGFTPDRLFVALTDFPAEGEISAMAVDRRGEIRVIDDFSVYAGKLQKTLSLGDKFKVRLLRADPIEMALQFEPERF